MNKELDKYTIWIVKENRKNKIIKQLQEKELSKIKIITLEELKKKYYFTYDERAIYYLIKKYSYQYDVAKMYLSHLIEVPKETTNISKVENLRKLKEELQEENLLLINPILKRYLKGKKIAIYDINDLTKLEQKMLKEIETNSEVYYYHEKKEEYIHKEIIECETEELEISFVASSIAELIKKGIDIKKIKVYATNTYEDVITRIFTWFKIPTSIEKNNLYATEIGQKFLENIKESKEESLEWLAKEYSLNNSKTIDIYNQIINILNNYTWCNNLKDLIPFLKEDFKKIKIEQKINENVVKIINTLEDAGQDDYIFLVGFNQGEIPKTYKDEDYFSDKEKRILNLETTDELNKRSYNIWLQQIKNTKNLTMTMKKNSSIGECYISNLNEDLKLPLTKVSENYQHSNLYNKLELSKKLDTLVKYNELENNISLLYQHYPELNYHTYNNNYQNIPSERIRKYLNYQLTLSYSSINTYYQCAFRYYLSNILKLNIFEDSFYTIIGNLYHDILSNTFTKEINIEEEYNKYIDKLDYPFNAREKYFLDKLLEELKFIIETIKKQNEENKLTSIETEEKIEVKKQYENVEVIFKGFIDKIMSNDSKDKIAIIDYKTGSPNLNLNNIIYGLDLQLPVYIYLAKQKYPKARIAGFYLQKILNTEITKDNKHEYQELKEEKLKLQGYTNSDLSLLKEFDPNYENSKMIKGMKTTSKGLSTKKILDDVQMEQLEDITNEKINGAMKEIANASFDINPKRIGMENLGCKYCNFKDICFMTEKNIINLKEYKNMEFLGGEDDDTNKTSECNLDR